MLGVLFIERALPCVLQPKTLTSCGTEATSAFLSNGSKERNDDLVSIPGNRRNGKIRTGYRRCIKRWLLLLVAIYQRGMVVYELEFWVYSGLTFAGY
jgi:hypothetical protein